MIDAPDSPAALTATEALAQMAAGDLTAEALRTACLSRIAARDKGVRAWISLNPQATGGPGPLSGIPIGIKDVFDTHDLPTTHNSPLYAGHLPAADAPAVAILRAAGAVILGKTDTTEFAAAGRDAVTANPHDLTRTPGGSSAGSAAAVADFHVPLALTTQTGGSTIRPGSYCGIPAFKPSWGLISTEGVKRYAVSFDTVGFFARDVADLQLLAGVYALPAGQAPSRPVLAMCRTPYAADLAPEMTAALSGLPFEMTELVLPERFHALDALHRIILHVEGAAAFRALTGNPLLHDDFHARVELRAGYTARMAFEAQDALAELRVEMERLMTGFDAVLAPSAPGVAPLGHGPGNPLFNALWTALQMPVVNLPIKGQGLPLGVSLVGRRATDGALLALAANLSLQLSAG